METRRERQLQMIQTWHSEKAQFISDMQTFEQ
jgi:hypothetical protein